MVSRPSLKRVVPGSVPPWRALVLRGLRRFRAAGVVFAPLSWLSIPGRKHGSDALVRLKPCCDAADSLQAPSQEKQARSNSGLAHAVSSRTFSGLFFSSVFGPEAASSCSPLNAACQLLHWSPPASRNFAAAPAALFFLRWVCWVALPRVEAGAWKRVLGGWD